MFGIGSVPHDDVIAAKLLLSNTRSFDGRYGEDWGQRSIEIRFESDAIRVMEESLATTMGGRPLDESESTFDYSLPLFGAKWNELAKNIGYDTWKRVMAIGNRLATGIFPCDVCGQTSQTLGLTKTLLSYTGPVSALASEEVPPELTGPLREAFAAQDMPAIRRMNRSWTEGYCEERDASYCKTHLPANRK